MADTAQAPTPTGEPPEAWPLSRLVAGIGVLIVVLALLIHLFGGGPGGAARGHASAHRPTLARHRVDAARLDVSGGVDRLAITSADLPGGDLVQAETPADERAIPVLRQPDSGSVAVSTAGTNNSGSGVIDLTVRLSRDVRWNIAVDSGTQLLTLDLPQARLQAVQVDVGVSTIEAELPRPTNDFVLRVSGGANVVRVREPAGVPTRVTFNGGGGGAVLDGVRHASLPGGAVLTTADWPSQPSQIPSSSPLADLVMDSGIGSFELARTAPP